MKIIMTRKLKLHTWYQSDFCGCRHYYITEILNNIFSILDINGYIYIDKRIHFMRDYPILPTETLTFSDNVSELEKSLKKYKAKNL